MTRKLLAYSLALLLIAAPAYADSPTDPPATAPTSGNTSNSQTSLLKTVMNLLNTISTKLAGTVTTSDAANGPVAPGTVAGKSELVGGQYNTSPPAPTNGQQVALQMDANGNAKVVGGTAKATADTNILYAPLGCDSLTSPPSYTTAQINPVVCDLSGNVLTKDTNGPTIATNTGNTATGVGGVADSAYTSGSGSIIAVLKGIFGKLAALGQTTMAGSIPVAIASNQSAVPTNPQAAATGGCTPGHFLTGASNNSTLIKNAAGTLCSLTVVQGTTTLGDVRLYDTGTSAPTCSSATGVVANYELQSNATSPGIAPPMGPFGMAFSNSIGICVTGAVADNDNTNFVTGVQVNYTYK